MANPFTGRAGVKAGKDIVFINSLNVEQTVFAYGKAYKNLIELMGQGLLSYDRKMKAQVEANFKSRIGQGRHDTTSVSRAHGSPGYGIERGRVSGRFVGPTVWAFKGVRRETKNKQRVVIGFPNVPFADKATNGIWRQLEFGAPAGFSSRPRGLFLPAGSDPNSPEFRRGRARYVNKKGTAKAPGPTRTGPEFHPQSKISDIPNPSQPAWLFIKTAFDKISREELPKMRRLPNKAFMRDRI